MPALALLTTVTAVVSSLGAPLVPLIAVKEGISLAAAQWSLTVALLSGAICTPLLGRLGGGRHRRLVILLGLAVVAAGASMAAVAPTFAWLIAGRAAQGVGVALTPLAIAVARDELPGKRVTSSVTLLSVTTVAGAGLGYPLSAWVAGTAGVAAAFWLGAVICALTGLLTALVVPASRSTSTARVDWSGAGLLAGATAGLLLAVTCGPSWGWTSVATLGLASSAVAVMAGWVRRSLRITAPLVDLRLAFRHEAMGANLIAVAAGVAVYMLVALVMIAVQAPRSSYGLGQPVTTAGLLLVPYSIATMIGSRLSLRIGRRIRPDFLLPLGSVVYLWAALLLAFRHSNVRDLLVMMAVSGLGSGFTFAPMPGLILRAIPAAETGSAMAFNHLLRFLGFATGSTTAVVALDVFRQHGLGPVEAFRGASLVAAGVWVFVCLISTCHYLLGRRLDAKTGKETVTSGSTFGHPELEAAAAFHN